MRSKTPSLRSRVFALLTREKIRDNGAPLTSGFPWQPIADGFMRWWQLFLRSRRGRPKEGASYENRRTASNHTILSQWNLNPSNYHRPCEHTQLHFESWHSLRAGFRYWPITMGPTRPQHHGGCEHEAQPRQQRVDHTRPHLSHNFQQWLGHSDMESTMRYLKS